MVSVPVNPGNLEYPGPGQDVCCVCVKPIQQDETIVGAGTGWGTGRDGYFTHRDCYDERAYASIHSITTHYYTSCHALRRSKVRIVPLSYGPPCQFCVRRKAGEATA